MIMINHIILVLPVPSIDAHNHYNMQMLSSARQHFVFEPANNNYAIFSNYTEITE